MTHTKFQLPKLGALYIVIASLGLGACTSYSEHMTSAGVAGFPPAEKSWTKDGKGESTEAMRLGALRVGMNAKEAFDALGAPHFNEGWGRPQYWDYIVRFPGRAEACRLKLQWDTMDSMSGQAGGSYRVKQVIWSEGCPAK